MNALKFRSLSPKFQNSKFSDKCKLIGNEWSWWDYIDSSGCDLGDPEVTSNGSNPQNPDVTYRAFGSERSCFLIGFYDIVTNTEKLTKPNLQGLASYFFASHGGSAPRITTNIENNTDQFIAIRAYNQNYMGYGYSIVVTQIDP